MKNIRLKFWNYNSVCPAEIFLKYPVILVPSVLEKLSSENS